MFLMTDYRYSYLSSSIVKEIAYLGRDIKDLVPPEVHSVICEKIARLKKTAINLGKQPVLDFWHIDDNSQKQKCCSYY